MVTGLRFDLDVKMTSPGGRTPAEEFNYRLVNRLGPRFDNINQRVAADLTTAGIKILNDQKVRPWESGSRKKHRETGKIAGHSGRSRALKSIVLGRGAGQRAGRGVQFPDTELLDRRTKHWRVVEEGTPYVTIPSGVFSDSSGRAQPLARGRTDGDRFMTYREFVRSKGIRQGGRRDRSSRARGRATRNEGGRTFWKGPARGRGYEGKFFIRGAWEQVVGRDGALVAQKYSKAIEDELGSFRLR